MTAKEKRKAEPGALIITGGALEKELVLHPSEWILNNPDFDDVYFSSNNHFGYQKIWRVKGYDLNRLLAEAGLRAPSSARATFVAADGFTFTENLAALNGRCLFPDLTSASEERSRPMVVLYSVLIFDGLDPQPPIAWKSRSLTEADSDRQRPRLMIGQQQNDPEDDNQAYFVGNLIRIEVETEQENID